MRALLSAIFLLFVFLEASPRTPSKDGGAYKCFVNEDVSRTNLSPPLLWRGTGGGSGPLVNEKVYIHTDNTSYYLTDTLWYKAYVVRADNLQPTDISKLLYVELITPDGIVVERQHIPVTSGKTTACGQFCLPDTLYSGYYELRAYTKWNLNFNVEHKPYSLADKRKFYNKRFCDDFFRTYPALYSRVFPVYDKPDSLGAWQQKYMHQRPKQRVYGGRQRLLCAFYPEGGDLVEGVPQRVAFELLSSDGQLLDDISGTLRANDLHPDITLRPTHKGKGFFTITPSSKYIEKALFTYEGKEYSFSLPKAKKAGAALLYDPLTKTVTIHSQQVRPTSLAILCRGQIVGHIALDSLSSPLSDSPRGEGVSSRSIQLLSFNFQLSTGVNELLLLDADGKALASRLVFINNHDIPRAVQLTLPETAEPYQRVQFRLKADSLPGRSGSLSIAITDPTFDSPSYDDGNILTSMLLEGDLRGFIPHPSYYFESDDEEHLLNLDLLLMVQGWRSYNYQVEARSLTPALSKGEGDLNYLRQQSHQQGISKSPSPLERVGERLYSPETTLTYEGQVLRVPSTLTTVELEDLEKSSGATDDVFAELEKLNNPEFATDGSDQIYGSDPTGSDAEDSPGKYLDSPDEGDDEGSDTADEGNPQVPLEGGFRGVLGSSSVYVEAEINIGGKMFGAVTQTDKRGRFRINLPPFYDYGILFVKAYSRADSLKKCLTSKRADKYFLDETAFPDYYVKRDLFFPIFSEPYSFYQVNPPETFYTFSDDDSPQPGNGVGSGVGSSVTRLRPIMVRAKRRGKRGIDYTKPALVRDAYEIYNDATDYGLSFGVLNYLHFPTQVATLLYGNMGLLGRQFNIRAISDRTTFFRNYKYLTNEYDKPIPNTQLYSQLKLARTLRVKAYTDYELRTDSCGVFENTAPALTLVFEPMPDDTKRYTYRDRRYVFPGINYPERFYQPQYTPEAVPQPQSPERQLISKRRTLYWNPNVQLDADGSFQDSFYNNDTPTRLKASVTGVTSDGKLITSLTPSPLSIRRGE